MSGGTTVAATMMCAHRAGVGVFVTGGLGGVHRGGEKSQTHSFTLPPCGYPCLHSFPAMDVSADVVELGRTPVAIVCAGVKSILDIGRTLEVLVKIAGGGGGVLFNNTHEATIALLPSTTHPQSWAEPHTHAHTDKSSPSVPPSPEEHNLPSICPSTPASYRSSAKD